MRKSPSFKIFVRGDQACFSSPFVSPERHSLPVPTPMSVIGIVNSIYWKPSIKYQVNSVAVLSEIEYGSEKVKEKKADGSPDLKTISFLKDVRYVFDFTMHMTGKTLKDAKSYNKQNPFVEDNILKHICCLERRVNKQQFFKEAYFGRHPYFVNEIKILSESEFKDILPKTQINDDAEIPYFPVRFDYTLKKLFFGVAILKDNIVTYKEYEQTDKAEESK